jgi:hypothetical protein
MNTVMHNPQAFAWFGTLVLQTFVCSHTLVQAFSGLLSADASEFIKKLLRKGKAFFLQYLFFSSATIPKNLKRLADLLINPVIVIDTEE